MSYTRHEGAPGNRGVFLFLLRRAHLLTTGYASGGILPLVGRALSEGDAAPAGAFGQCCISAELPSLSTQSSKGFAFNAHPLPPACENLPPAALSQQ